MSKNLTIRVPAKTFELIQRTAAASRISMLDFSSLIFNVGLQEALKAPVSETNGSVIDPINEAAEGEVK